MSKEYNDLGWCMQIFRKSNLQKIFRLSYLVDCTSHKLSSMTSTGHWDIIKGDKQHCVLNITKQVFGVYKLKSLISHIEIDDKEVNIASVQEEKGLTNLLDTVHYLKINKNDEPLRAENCRRNGELKGQAPLPASGCSNSHTQGLAPFSTTIKSIPSLKLSSAIPMSSSN